MNKKYIVRLTDEERLELVSVIAKLKGTSQKVKRAQILLKADADGSNWPHHQIAEAFLCRTKTVSNVCKSLVERGFGITLEGKKRDTPPRAKLLDGEQEAKRSLHFDWVNRRKVIAIGRYGLSRRKRLNWESSNPSVTQPWGQRLKKSNDEPENSVLGDTAGEK